MSTIEKKEHVTANIDEACHGTTKFEHDKATYVTLLNYSFPFIPFNINDFHHLIL